MIRENKILSLAIVFLFVVLRAHGQAELLKEDQQSALSNSYTHVIVTERNFPGADEFLEIFKKYWTITKGVDFVKLDPRRDKLISGDSYFAFKGEDIRYGDARQLFFYFQLSIAKEKSPGSEKNNEIPVANIYTALLADNKEFMGYLTKGLPFSLDGDGHVLNWNPGTIKNYLQQLTALIQANKKTGSPAIAVKDELHNLQSQPLYCTADNFYHWAMFRQPRPDDENEMDDVFKGYDYTIKYITNKELQDKILADKEPFYYFEWINLTSTGGYLCVINSRTGKMVFCGTNHWFPNLERSYLKELNRAITKSTK